MSYTYLMNLTLKNISLVALLLAIILIVIFINITHFYYQNPQPSQIKNVSVDEVAAITTHNAEKIFGL